MNTVRVLYTLFLREELEVNADKSHDLWPEGTTKSQNKDR